MSQSPLHPLKAPFTPGRLLGCAGPSAGYFPPEESSQSPPGGMVPLPENPVEPCGLSCLRRAPFHRGKGAKARRGLRPPEPPWGGDRTSWGSCRVVSRCRLGGFVRNSGTGHASCSRGNSAPEASDLVPTRAAMAACVCASGFLARGPLVQLEPFRSPGAGMPLSVILRPGTGRRIRTLRGEADSSLCSE